LHHRLQSATVGTLPFFCGEVRFRAQSPDKLGILHAGLAPFLAHGAGEARPELFVAQDFGILSVHGIIDHLPG
jgi:hypothetical protein